MDSPKNLENLEGEEKPSPILVYKKETEDIETDFYDPHINYGKEWELTIEMSKDETNSIYISSLKYFNESNYKGNNDLSNKMRNVSSIYSIKPYFEKIMEKIIKNSTKHLFKMYLDDIDKKEKKDKKHKKNKLHDFEQLSSIIQNNNLNYDKTFNDNMLSLHRTISNIQDYLYHNNNNDILKRTKSSKVHVKKTDLLIHQNNVKHDNKLLKELDDLLELDSLNHRISYFNIIEYIILYFMHFVNKGFKSNNFDLFINSFVSLRDTYKENYNLLENNADIIYMIDLFIDYYIDKMKHHKQMWITFINDYSYRLFNNHYKNSFKHNLKLYDEQQNLLNLLNDNDMEGLYILPWGIGCGKTALVAPLSHLIHQEKGISVFYCISKPPVKDQTAANMYRCGIPFAYINKIGHKKYSMNPSYHCKNTLPYMYIVQNDFIYDYQQRIYDDDELEIHIPYYKPDYKHLEKLEKILLDNNYNNGFNKNYSLIIDEPDKTDNVLNNIIQKLPKLSFIMSATSFDIIDEKVQNLYMRNNHLLDKEKYINVVSTQRIGITTTLLSYWNNEEQILSPFSLSKNKDDLQKQLNRIKVDNVYKRFLSPQLLIDLYNKFKNLKSEFIDFTYDFDEQLLKFDFKNISFDNIIQHILEFVNNIIQSNITDDFIIKLFDVKCDISKTEEILYEHILETQSWKFGGGCIIGTSNIEEIYNKIEQYKIKKDDIVTIDEINQQLTHYVSSIKSNIKKELSDITNQKNRQLHSKNNDINIDYFYQLEENVYESKMINKIPIHNKHIINSIDFLKHHNTTSNMDDRNYRYIIPLKCNEIGNIKDHIQGWKYELNLTHNISELKEITRIIGVGSIFDKEREFYMKNIKDLNKGYLAYNITDSSGAFGLNLLIQNMILMHDIIDLPNEIILQKIGRVGRQGQLATGFVYLTHPSILHKLFTIN